MTEGAKHPTVPPLYPRGRGFGAILIWHVEFWGTSPKCSFEKRNELAHPVDIAAATYGGEALDPTSDDRKNAKRSFLNWRNDGRLPGSNEGNKVDRLCNVLFGASPSGTLSVWEADLRAALDKDRRRLRAERRADAKTFREEMEAYLVGEGQEVAQAETVFGAVANVPGRNRADLSDIVALARQQLVSDGTLDRGIEEAVVRVIVSRLGAEGVPREDLMGWLRGWPEAVHRQLERPPTDDEEFEAARSEAAHRFQSGKGGSSSEPLMRLLQSIKAGFDRRRIQIVDEAIRFDLLVFDVNAALAKVELITSFRDWRDRSDRELYLSECAKEFHARGERTADSASLLLSLKINELLLETCDRETAPLRWATVLSDTANAQLDLGQREILPSRLQEAIANFRLALEVTPRNTAHEAWASISNDLGSALVILGEREGCPSLLEEAATIHERCLEAFPRHDEPLEWAKTQSLLSNAFASLGELQNNPTLLRKAVDGYRAALEERTRALDPVNWAKTLCNLGTVLRSLGVHNDNPQHLREAVAAYREALEELPKERFPFQWAIAQVNLGAALQDLGEQDRLGDAVHRYKSALSLICREHAPLHWADYQNCLGTALHELGVVESDVSLLHEALAAYQAALEEQTRNRVPIAWAKMQNNRGNALASLAKQNADAQIFRDAISAYELALEELSDDVNAHLREIVENHRAGARIKLMLIERRNQP